MLSCFLAVLYAEASRRRGAKRCFHSNTRTLVAAKRARLSLSPRSSTLRAAASCRNFDVLHVFDLVRR